MKDEVKEEKSPSPTQINEDNDEPETLKRLQSYPENEADLSIPEVEEFIPNKQSEKSSPV